MAGYSSILDRVGLLISANVNALLNKALGMNQVAVFDEYINRMGESYESLETAEGIERGRSRTLARQIEELEADTAKLDSDVDRLLEKGERALAAARQAVLNTKLGLMKDMQENLDQSQSEAAKLGNAKAKLQAQIEVTRAKRLELVSLLEQKKASDLRLRAQAGVRDIGENTHTGEIIEKARQDLELAQGKEEASSNSLDRRIDEVLGSDEIEAQLAERESRIRRLPAGN